MGKLNILHHKSYHVYKADNIEKVRRDEAEAKAKEENEEGRMMLADSEARLNLLRSRVSGSSTSRKKADRLKDEADMKRIADGTQGLTRRSVSPSLDEVATLTTPSGHFSLFAGLESSEMSSAQLQLMEKKARDAAAERAEKGAPLAPTEHDLKPWYTDRELKGAKQRALEGDTLKYDRRQLQQVAHKTLSDPLRSMNAHLKRRAEVLEEPSESRLTKKASYASSADPLVARIEREASERARAEALLAKRKKNRSIGGSSVADDTPREEPEYRDVYNVRETREAREARDRGSRPWASRRWDEVKERRAERDRGQDRGWDR